MDVVFATWRRGRVVTWRKKERRSKAAREKSKRSPLAGPPQEFPPAKPEKPTFFPRGLQATLPFSRTEKFSIGLPGRQSRVTVVLTRQLVSVAVELKSRLATRASGRKREVVQRWPQSRFCSSRQAVNALKLNQSKPWACSSAGRAPALQAGGRRFEPCHVHQISSSFQRSISADFLVAVLRRPKCFD